MKTSPATKRVIRALEQAIQHGQEARARLQREFTQRSAGASVPSNPRVG